MKLSSVFLTLVLFFGSARGTTITTQPVDATTTHITVNMEVPPNDCVYKEYINFSTDNPSIVLSEWQSDTDPTNAYDTAFKETKKIFKKPFKINLTAHTTPNKSIPEAHLHVSYYLRSEKKIIEEVLPLTIHTAHKQADHAQLATAVAAQEHEITDIPEPQKEPTPPSEKTSWSSYVSNLVHTTQSLWIRMLLVLLLGLLMSLTPCVYPMIPITVGVLQSQGSKSVLYNFLLASSYTAGIATTFALLGLLAAFTGQIFGSIMGNPVFVLIIVMLLVYLALSMFGLYEMYIPRFLQNNKASTKGGSILSAFLFGSLSGTVASPCLSPGLVLLLSIVTAIGNVFIGFMLLFAFGIGLGIPLLIIGTFSSSLNVLPKAGTWMVEVKKMFGFIMFGMCFYFLNNIMPWHFLLILITSFNLLSGALYLNSARVTSAMYWRYAKNILGMLLVASSMVLTAHTFKAWHTRHDSHDSFWITDYNQALTKARQEDKKMFIDIGAPFCSMCKMIDKKILHNPAVKHALHSFIATKIDGSAEHNQAIADHYKVIGFPTILLVDAHTQKVIKQWDASLYGESIEDFVQELQALV